jgi:uncharacterized membrane protein
MTVHHYSPARMFGATGRAGDDEPVLDGGTVVAADEAVAPAGPTSTDELDDTGDLEASTEEPPRPSIVERLRVEPALAVLVLAMLVWFAVFGTLIWQRHARYATFDFDLGHHDQAIWLLAHGKGFITVSGMPVLGHHFTLAYFALAPLYWLGGGPQLLDLLQTAALALSALPIFVFARDRLGNGWPALAFGVAWLLNPSVQWLCWEAWHPETIAIPFLLTAYLMASRQRWRWYWAFLVAALTWKEDVALAAIMLGIVLVVRRQRRVGAWTIAVGVAWFVLAYQIAMPHFNGGLNHAGTFYGELGGSPSEIIRTALTDPQLVIGRLDDNDALGYARDLLAPWAFTPLVAPLLLLVALPQFLANALANQTFFYDIRFHYVAIILAVLALASVEGVARLRPIGMRRFAVGAVAAAALASSVAWGMSPISTQYRSGYWPLAGNPRQAVLDAAVDAVPGDAAVSASYYIVPHLSHREQIYTFPNPWIPANWGVAGVAPHDPDHDHVPAEVEWLVVDTTTHTPGSREETLMLELVTNGEFEVVSDEGGIVVARRVAPPADDTAANDTTTTDATTATTAGASG